MAFPVLRVYHGAGRRARSRFEIEILRVQGADPASLDIMERQIAKLREIVNRSVPG
jgi:hypothetical protein